MSEQNKDKASRITAPLTHYELKLNIGADYYKKKLRTGNMQTIWNRKGTKRKSSD